MKAIFLCIFVVSTPHLKQIFPVTFLKRLPCVFKVNISLSEALSPYKKVLSSWI